MLRHKLTSTFQALTPTQKALAKKIVSFALVLAWIIVTLVSLYQGLSAIKLGNAALLLLFLLWLRIRANRKTNEIFVFYVAANEILGDAEGTRYHFEIADVVANGEKIIKSMPDAPPLSRFALGALYFSIGDHNGAVEQLGFAAEEKVLKESQYLSPSPQLRRYVKRLRKIERRPKRYAKLTNAVASLERMQHERAAGLLAESQKHLRRLVEAYDNEKVEQERSPRRADFVISNARSLKSITAPPTISEVLNEVYQEEPKAS